MTGTTLTSRRTLTTSEVAEALGCSPETIRRFANRGVLPHVRLTPRSPRRFDRTAVEQLLEQRSSVGALRDMLEAELDERIAEARDDEPAARDRAPAAMPVDTSAYDPATARIPF